MATMIRTAVGLEKTFRDARQRDVLQWIVATFGDLPNFDPLDEKERARRFLEEALELGQALGLEVDDVQRISSRVYSRLPGLPSQEVGGVCVTLMGLAQVLGLSVYDEEIREFSRVTKVDKATFQARHKAKMEVGT
ncbi:hypothetical protein ACRQ1B_06175 [Rhizobium panacihumi]|uniref:hypothetical protein n=1 Tax=Rhizobium panacihumi TaxID=2008450 RepID=UPI003D7904E2